LKVIKLNINSKRKAGFHWIALSLSKKYEVTFITAPIRYSTLISKDHRTSYFKFSEINKPIKVGTITSYVYMTLANPISSKHKFIAPFFNLFVIFYGSITPKNLKNIFSNADVIIFESNDALLLFDKISRINPVAKKIYRVSDDLKTINASKVVQNYEAKISSKFDLISVPSEYIYHKFDHLPQTKLLNHGIHKKLFSKIYRIPKEYVQFEINILFVGTSHFDHNFLSVASSLFPNWGFHIIGPIEKINKEKNIRYYGELPFNETIPYIQHADIGLQTRKSDIGLASLSDSLKVLQYTYCRLPIIAPKEVNSSRINFFYYIPGDRDSIQIALTEAINFDRTKIDVSKINSWDEVAELIINEVLR